MFFCGPEKEAKKRLAKMADLKQLVENIEEKMVVPCTLACCPICAPPCLINQELVKKAPPPPLMPPDVMVCYRVERRRGEKTSPKKSTRPVRTKRAKSRELRASILYQGCDCEKRNGLQDDCPRTGCHGSPECLTKPEPICGPSEFSSGKHLGKRFDYWDTGAGAGGEGNEEPEENEKPTIYYNCYPATVKC